MDQSEVTEWSSESCDEKMNRLLTFGKNFSRRRLPPERRPSSRPTQPGQPPILCTDRYPLAPSSIAREAHRVGAFSWLEVVSRVAGPCSSFPADCSFCQFTTPSTVHWTGRACAPRTHYCVLCTSFSRTPPSPVRGKRLQATVPPKYLYGPRTDEQRVSAEIRVVAGRWILCVLETACCTGTSAWHRLSMCEAPAPEHCDQRQAAPSGQAPTDGLSSWE